MYRVTLNSSEQWFRTLEEAEKEYEYFKELKLVVGGLLGDTIRMDYCGDTGESLQIKRSVLCEIEDCFDEAGLPTETAIIVDVCAEWVEEDVPVIN